MLQDTIRDLLLKGLEDEPRPFQGPSKALRVTTRDLLLKDVEEEFFIRSS